jgi:hypothetical protein
MSGAAIVTNRNAEACLSWLFFFPRGRLFLIAYYFTNLLLDRRRQVA